MVSPVTPRPLSGLKVTAVSARKFFSTPRNSVVWTWSSPIDNTRGKKWKWAFCFYQEKRIENVVGRENKGDKKKTKGETHDNCLDRWTKMDGETIWITNRGIECAMNYNGSGNWSGWESNKKRDFRTAKLYTTRARPRASQMNGYTSAIVRSRLRENLYIYITLLLPPAPSLLPAALRLSCTTSTRPSCAHVKPSQALYPAGWWTYSDPTAVIIWKKKTGRREDDNSLSNAPKGEKERKDDGRFIRFISCISSCRITNFFVFCFHSRDRLGESFSFSVEEK